MQKISVENIKLELMRTTYSTSKTWMSSLDPRVLLIWYLIFAIVPWLFYDARILIALLVFVGGVVSCSKVSKMIMFLLFFGIASEMVCYGIMALLLGGNLEAFQALIILTLKLVIISLASIAVFASMDAEKLGDALLSFGLSGRFTFGISYGYRMLPLLIEEYHAILHAYRLRGRAPREKGFLYWRYLFYNLKLMVKAFYPLMFNSAKRTRTTVEALELKGFSYSLEQSDSKALKLAYLQVQPKDMCFLFGAILYVLTAVFVAQLLGGV